ncbi:HotDog domain-containing protein [Aspergillus spectabilis]
MTQSTPPTDNHHFQVYPLATRLLGDTQHYSVESFGRHNEAEGDRFGYFGNTLATPKTIPNRLILRRRNLPTLPNIPPPWPVATTDPLRSQPYIFPPDVIVLLDLGKPGVSGHASTAHGGVIASSFDETMHKAIEAHVPATGQAEKPYTAQLDIRYKRPVRVPGLLVIRAKVVARVGRKFWVRAHASQELETGEEILTTDAMALFLMVSPSSQFWEPLCEKEEIKL